MKPRVIISSCLLGNKVRFDGMGRAHKWVLNVLSNHLTLEPVCPEMSMGLGSPREPLRIVKNSDTKQQRLFTIKTSKDLTELANETTARIINNLGSIDGLILMSNSPMCGIKFVKVYESKNQIPHKDGIGLFARELMNRYPHLPIIEAYRLDDEPQREAFLSHLFSLYKLKKEVFDPRSLQSFHRQHKFLFLSYNPRVYRLMGPLVANTRSANLEESLMTYTLYLKEVFYNSRKPSHGYDALLHIYGFLKKALSKAEQRVILQLMDDYRNGKGSIQIPLTLMGFLNVQINSKYLQEQVIFSPFPSSLEN